MRDPGDHAKHMTGWKLEGPKGPYKTYDRVETGGTLGEAFRTYDRWKLKGWGTI